MEPYAKELQQLLNEKDLPINEKKMGPFIKKHNGQPKEPKPLKAKEKSSFLTTKLTEWFEALEALGNDE